MTEPIIPPHGPLPALELPGFTVEEVEVESRPSLPSFTEFPPSLVEKLGGSHRLSWQPRSDRQMAMLRHVHIHPVYTEDLSEAERERLKREGYSRESLKDGMIYNGDCVLCIQPHEAYNREQARLARINHMRQSADSQQEAFDAELQALAARTGKATGKRLVYDQVPGANTNVEEQVLVNRQLVDPSAWRNRPNRKED